MKVLLTGATGFIGAKLLKELINVFGVRNIVVFSSSDNEDVKSIVYDKSYNIRKDDEAILSEIEIIIHAGAFTPKNRESANSILGANSNIIFTDRLLSYQYPKLKKIIFFSTIDVYENINEVYSEASLVSPSTLYGHSKVYCEKMIEAYCSPKNLSFNILRVGHVYGPGEEAYEKFLPVAIKKIIMNDVVELWTDGEESRSFIYVDDVVSACVSAISKESLPRIINVASGYSISMNNLILLVGKLLHRKAILEKKGLLSDARSYIFDDSLLKKHLLPSETKFEIGLLNEIEYFKRKLSEGDI